MPDGDDRPLPVLGTALRVLTFRADRATLLALDGRHLAFGLIATWLVGMGRWWDDPGAHVIQKLGTGSVVYVFVLATALWAVLLPLRPEGLSWRRALIYVTLTAPPAAIYAIPVERWMTVRHAMTVNLWFLVVVAAWRVLLVAVWMVRGLGLRRAPAVAALLLPVILVVWALAAINPERALELVFDVMGGVRDRPPPTPGDAAYHLVQGLACAGGVLFIPLLVAYVAEIAKARRLRRRAGRAEHDDE